MTMPNPLEEDDMPFDLTINRFVDSTHAAIKFYVVIDKSRLRVVRRVNCFEFAQDDLRQSKVVLRNDSLPNDLVG